MATSRASRFREHRAMYNRWANRHTILIWCSVAVLLSVMLIVIAGQLSHPTQQLPGGSGPTMEPGRLP